MQSEPKKTQPEKKGFWKEYRAYQKNRKRQEKEEKKLRREERKTLSAEQRAANRKKRAEERKKGTVVKWEVLSWILTIATALIAVLIVRTFIAEAVRVEGVSMSNTLTDQEIVLESKLDYLFGEPQQNDIVICHYPGRGSTLFVKRLVAMPGQTVKIQGHKLYIDGVEQADPEKMGSLPHDYAERRMGKEGVFRYDGDTEVPITRAQVNALKAELRCDNGGITVYYDGDAPADPADGDVWVDAAGQAAYRYSEADKAWKAFGGGDLYQALVLAGEDQTDGCVAVLSQSTYTHLLDANQVSEGDLWIRTDERDAVYRWDGSDWIGLHDEYLAVGDNRGNSHDSRSTSPDDRQMPVGPLTRSEILGKVKYVIWPVSSWRNPY